MKINHSTAFTLFTTAFGLAVFSPTLSAEANPATPPLEAPTKAIITITVTPPAPRTDQIAQLSTSPARASVQWFDIKDCTYDTRAQFFAGFKRLEARVDDQISALAAKRATMNSSVDTKDWDFAMKEMVDSRSYLKSMGEELVRASPETWSQQKDKVALAWARTQDAYGRVKSRTTS